MTARTVAGRLLEVVAHHGVTTAFGLPGVHNLAFWRARAELAARSAGGADEEGWPLPPDLVTVRHEATAAYAADGLARATGGLGIALVTSGPGAANTLAAVGEAAASRSPVVVIASDVPSGLRAPRRVRGLLHESADQGALFAPLVKSVLQPEDAESTVAAVALAVQKALTPPFGPVYLGVASDILDQPPPDHELDAPRPRQPRVPTAPEVAVAAELVNSCDRPVIWAGGGVVAASASSALDALAWRIGAPVVTTFAGRGCLPPGHPLLVDVPPHEPVVDQLLRDADLLLVLGSALDGMTTRNWTMPRPARVIDVNVAPSGELQPDVTVIADVATTIDALALRLRPRAPWADTPYALRDQVRNSVREDPRTTTAANLLDAVEQTWPDDGFISCDMAVAGYWVGGYAQLSRPRQLAYPVGWGTLGFGLPAALGAATTGRPTLAVVGDGGLAMGLGELATLVQEDLPVTVLVVDDGGYGMLRFDDAQHGSTAGGLDLRSPDWRSLATSFGMRGYEIAGESPPVDGLVAALSDAAASGGPSLVVWREALFPPRTTSPRWREG